MTERKFTRNLKSRGMAQQLRESVSKVIHQDLINVCNSHQLKIFQSHHDPIDIILALCEFNHGKRNNIARMINPTARPTEIPS